MESIVVCPWHFWPLSPCKGKSPYRCSDPGIFFLGASLSDIREKRPDHILCYDIHHPQVYIVSTSDIARSPLSGHAATLLSQLSAQGKTIFAGHEAQALTSLSPRHLDKLLQRLVRQKWLVRLSKGLYLILPLEAGVESRYTEHEFLIASRLITPSAIAYWSALNYHGLTEQIPRTVFVATPRRRFHAQQTILGITYRFITVAPARFFGLKQVWLDGHPVQITDPEKTLVDALDQPHRCGGLSEVAEAFWLASQHADFSWDLFTRYAERMSNRAIFKRAGYLGEQLNLPLTAFYPRWQANLSQGYVRLDPGLPTGGHYNARWRVRVNIDSNDLLEWQQH
ncbi:MAG: type IV toxin-antitoxin system AbiEi family antitoxin domain-containing protein [Chloroflexi bacterium]|nr:type IV toxin-antitoxin system AbiEi family antitoxin domain-containing protein [Chloroflexota bacterium]